MSILHFNKNFFFGQNGPPLMDYNPFMPYRRPNMLLGGLFGLLDIFTIGLMSRIAMRRNNNFLNRMYRIPSAGNIWGVPNYDANIGFDTFNPVLNQRQYFADTNYIIPKYNPLLNSGFSWKINSDNTNIDYKTGVELQKNKTPEIEDNTIIRDGTPITLSDVNYDIMGDSAETVKKLRPEMQRKVEKLFKYAVKRGWTLTINGEKSGFRTQKQQNELIAQGRPAAKGNTSRHLKGCAVDIKINGSSNTPLLNLLGNYAKQIGMRWGGDFTNPTREKWHFDIDPDSTPKGTVGDNTEEV